jgi:hypothetical protein
MGFFELRRSAFDDDHVNVYGIKSGNGNRMKMGVSTLDFGVSSARMLAEPILVLGS